MYTLYVETERGWEPYLDCTTLNAVLWLEASLEAEGKHTLWLGF